MTSAIWLIVIVFGLLMLGMIIGIIHVCRFNILYKKCKRERAMGGPPTAFFDAAGEYTEEELAALKKELGIK